MGGDGSHGCRTQVGRGGQFGWLGWLGDASPQRCIPPEDSRWEEMNHMPTSTSGKGGVVRVVGWLGGRTTPTRGQPVGGVTTWLSPLVGG